jgi:hypothetical protein
MSYQWQLRIACVLAIFVGLGLGFLLSHPA